MNCTVNAAPEDSAHLEERIRILLIEDSMVDAHLLETAFPNRVASIDIVTTLEAGRRRLSSFPYDLIFLDLLLPDSHGLDKISEIQALAPTTPIVVVTGMADGELARKALQLGADDYLPKSEWTPSLLKRAARQALDRTRARKDLLQNERWLKAICQASRDGILVEHHDSVVFANQACAELFGYESVAEILGQSASNLCSTHEKQRVTEYGKQRQSGENAPQVYEFQGSRKDGSTLEAEVSASTFTLQGETYIISVIRNIEERKRAENSLRLAEFALQQAPDAITWLDSEGRYLYANQAFSHIVGFTPQEACEKSVFEVDPNLSPSSWKKSWEGLRQGDKETIRTTLRTPDGKMVPVEIRTTLIVRDGQEYCLALTRDIREGLRKENALRELATQNQTLYESEKEARLLQEASHKANLALSESLDLDQCLQRLLSILQSLVPCDRAHVLLSTDGNSFCVRASRGGEGWCEREALHSIRLEADRNAILGRMVAEKKALMISETAVDPDWERIAGAEQVHSWLGVPLVAQGKLIGIYSLDHERPNFFTEGHLRLAEAVSAAAALAIHNALLHEAALKSEERYKDLFENAKDWIFTIDSERKLSSLNKAAVEQLGYAPNELIGHTLDKLLSSESLMHCNHILTQVLQTGVSANEEIRAISRAGKSLLLEVSFRLIRGPESPLGFQCIARDISARKHLEESLRQARQMEAIGRLAGGVAHDFNNLLMIIRGYAELLREEVPDSEAVKKVEEILTASGRAANLTRELLTVGRRQMRRPAIVDLNHALAKLGDALPGIFPSDLRFQLLPFSEPLYVRMDPEHLQRVLLNLALNAKDAMPGGGLFRMELKRQCVEKHEPLLAYLDNPGCYALLTIHDTGSGISPEVLPLIFEPFFTTKDRGKGTGLGLAMVYAIVKQAGGHVMAESAIGEGATFRVWLPLTEDATRDSMESEPKGERGALPGGTETILLVEDEAPLRRLAESLLREIGYAVISAANGEEALQAVRDYPGYIHLLLTDVIMPGMNGREIAESICASRPETKVLFMSGFTDQVLARQGGLPAGIELLEKPFTRRALAQRIRQVIASRKDGTNQKR